MNRPKLVRITATTIFILRVNVVATQENFPG